MAHKYFWLLEITINWFNYSDVDKNSNKDKKIRYQMIILEYDVDSNWNNLKITI
jgi:hypothetical protein